MEITGKRSAIVRRVVAAAACALVSASLAAQPRVRREPVAQLPTYQVMTVSHRVEIPLMDRSGAVRAIMVFMEGTGRRTITFADPAGNPMNEIGTGASSTGGAGPPIREVPPMRGLAVSDQDGRSDSSLVILQNQVNALQARLNEVIRNLNAGRR